ncbi:MAG: hypothetical protein MUC64_17450, partial [Rubritepida sp.]|nr:hypothetical protein [Rubritepida sp.]
MQVIALPADGARAAAEQALARAAIEGRDLLLVSPGVTPGPGAVEELAAGLAADPMAGFVAPRAVNAPAAAAALRRLAPQLPRFATAPLPPPGCLLLRATMAAEFAPLDPAI